MFEMLLEALRELFDPTPARPAPRRRTGQPADAASEPAPRDEQPVREELTIEDVFRRLVGAENEAEVRQAAPAPTPEPTRQSARRSARQPRRREAVATTPSAAPAQRQATKQSKPLTFQETIARAERQDAVRKEEAKGTTQQEGQYGLEFVKQLRANPAAARDALVYAEIFGRPLGERM